MLTEDIITAENEENELRDITYHNEALLKPSCTGLEFNRITFVKCKLSGCDFTGCSFYNCMFESCDLSNCNFSRAYFKDCTLKNCKADGGKYHETVFKKLVLSDCALRYANFAESRWEQSRAVRCSFADACLSHVLLIKTAFSESGFTGADFFRTPLKGVDLSDCQIDGITVSESLQELRGVKINTVQAVDFARLLGAEIL